MESLKMNECGRAKEENKVEKGTWL
jgi:hypothetical protein